MNLPDRRLRPSASPGRLAELLLDVVIAAACYPLAYRIRFADAQFHGFLPYALKTLPLVAERVSDQLAQALAGLDALPASPSRAALRELALGLADRRT